MSNIIAIDSTPRKSPCLMKYNINVNSPIVCSTPKFELNAFTPSPESESGRSNPSGSEIRIIEVNKMKKEKGKEKEDGVNSNVVTEISSQVDMDTIIWTCTFWYLLLSFFMTIFVEFLSHSYYVNKNHVDHVTSGLLQKTLYGLRIGLAYVVMLVVMSFNGCVFLVGIVGHSLGFLFFGSRILKKISSAKNLDLPPMSCSC
ncbi:hypothetical protein H5410_022115 [Solanum commersonii]|uniref:Copper transport protein n=1 Tax=Solanum commersonii TaxID=4109 RepID=A0A9J5ZDV5_SOLCO|nr:hypothetical protein H5410_022115 [Solanum commersonii]